MTFLTTGISWTRVRVPRLLSTTFLALYGFTAILHGTGELLGVSTLYGAATALALINWLFLIASYILSLTSSWVVGELKVDAESVAVIQKGASRTIARREIVGALLVERPVGEGHVTTVEMELAGGDRLTVRFHDAGQARALVDALGYGPSGARVRVRLALPSRRLFHVIAAAMAWTIATLGGILADESSWRFGLHWELLPIVSSVSSSLCALALYLLFRRALRPPEVIFGDEGATVTSAFRKRFFARADSRLASAIAQPLLDNARLLAFLRAEGARERVTAVNVQRLAAFARAGKSLEGWRADLGRRLDHATYRSNSTTLDEAAAVLRCSHATPEQRLGAALTLRIGGESPERIRVAAEASIDEDVRAALEAAARDDDVAVEHVLRKMHR